MGDRVTWRGWKFFLPQVHHTLITGYLYPTFFQDTQERGRFARFQHDHHLTETPSGTLLEDEVRFALPFGPLGRVVARLISDSAYSEAASSAIRTAEAPGRVGGVAGCARAVLKPACRSGV